MFAHSPTLLTGGRLQQNLMTRCVHRFLADFSVCLCFIYLQHLFYQCDVCVTKDVFYVLVFCLFECVFFLSLAHLRDLLAFLRVLPFFF